MPDPPSELDEAARQKYLSTAELLQRHGIMSELDVGAIARYAVIWNRWLAAEKEVKQRGGPPAEHPDHGPGKGFPGSVGVSKAWPAPAPPTHCGQSVL